MLEITQLNKKFGKYYAVEDLNLHVDKGTVFGFVGHNGAGKTTTMKIVAGLLAANSGSVMIDGIDAFKHRRQVKRKIGYMPDTFGVYDNLKVLEYLEFYASMYGIVGKDGKKVCGELLELVNLEDKQKAYVDSLSRGMKQRLCLARCLVHDPELLLLDEPASGLDPRSRFEMKEIMKKLSSMGKTVMISSHILPELADMCDTIGIMQKGSLIMHGTVEEIEREVLHTRPLHIRISEGLEKAEHILRADSRSESLAIENDELITEYAGNQKEISELLKRLLLEDVIIESFYKEKGSLETLFLEMTEDTEKDSGASPSVVEAGNLSYDEPAFKDGMAPVKENVCESEDNSEGAENHSVPVMKAGDSEESGDNTEEGGSMS